MSFVVGRPRSIDVNGNQQQPSGLHALIERIDLDGRDHKTKPFRSKGGVKGFIKAASRWIAASCKERELWWNYRDVQMVNYWGVPKDDSKKKTLQESPSWKQGKRYSFREMDADIVDEMNVAQFDDVTVSEAGYDAEVQKGQDRRTVKVPQATQWEYVRSDEPLPFLRYVLHYMGRKAGLRLFRREDGRMLWWWGDQVPW